jgi:hypothetical protein
MFDSRLQRMSRKMSLLIAMIMVCGLWIPSAARAADRSGAGAAPLGAVVEVLPQEPVAFCTLPTRTQKAVRQNQVQALTVVGETEPNNTQATGNFIALGFDAGEDNAFDITGTLAAGDLDFFTFDLEPGDILGVNRIGAGSAVRVNDPAGVLLVNTATDASFIYPVSSPLPGGGGRALAWVVDTAGTYALRTSGGTGGYTLEVRLFRPELEQQGAGNKQILFIDFDGATVNAPALFGSGNPTAVLSPLSSFLAGWGLTAADESAVIDAILAAIEENLNDVGLLGNNGDFATSGIDGEYAFELQNSRDDPDPFGQPNVSRVIVGGTIAQLGISTIGIAEDIDPGNFEIESTAVTLLDLLSTVASNPNSLNQYPLAPGTTKIDVVGVGVGNITAHEAGHFFGNFHTNRFNANQNIMDQGGNLDNLVGVGPDGIFGSADDVDVDFGDDNFANEGFTGVEDTLNVLAFGLSTGTAAVCGNGVIETPEVCDGLNLGGQTCVTQGFDAGTLACAGSCLAFDTTGCFNCRKGKSDGSWNLPTTASGGTVVGTLYDAASVPLYKLNGTLTLATSGTTGRFGGTLADGFAPDPDYTFSGSWTLSPGFTDRGTFSAKIIDPVTNTSVGVIEGRFQDNPTLPIIGTYGGKWEICP